jgi:hypothetical protein
MNNVTLKVTVSGFDVFVGAKYLGPISKRRAADIFEAIPLALNRARVYGHAVSSDVVVA